MFSRACISDYTGFLLFGQNYACINGSPTSDCPQYVNVFHIQKDILQTYGLCLVQFLVAFVSVIKYSISLKANTYSIALYAMLPTCKLTVSYWLLLSYNAESLLVRSIPYQEWTDVMLVKGILTWSMCRVW